MENWITLARIVRPQGRKGEVLCDLLTDFPAQFTTTPAVNLLLPTGTRTPAAVEAHWLPTGRSAGRIVLKLAGSDTISAAELLAGAEVQIPAEARLALDEETFYVTDLLDCTLVDGETTVGIVRDLHFPHDAEGRRLPEAAPLFVVERQDGDEVLIPFANAFVQRISIPEKRIEMRLPTGLIEMNG